METVAQDSGEGHCVCSLYSSKNISGKVKIRMESVTISGTLGSRSEKHIIIWAYMNQILNNPNWEFAGIFYDFGKSGLRKRGRTGL